MAYDEALAERMRAALADTGGFEEKKMFGGVAFLIGGHMACGIAKGELMIRVGPDAYDAALARAHAREMLFTGKPMKGLIYVEPEGFRTDRELAGWIAMGVDHVRTLAPKRPKAPRLRKRATASR